MKSALPIFAAAFSAAAPAADASMVADLSIVNRSTGERLRPTGTEADSMPANPATAMRLGKETAGERCWPWFPSMASMSFRAGPLPPASAATSSRRWDRPRSPAGASPARTWPPLLHRLA